jgi:hypothetical protein
MFYGDEYLYVLPFLQAELEKEGLPETESLWCMAQSSAHRKVVLFIWNFFYHLHFLISFFTAKIRHYQVYFPGDWWLVMDMSGYFREMDG